MTILLVHILPAKNVILENIQLSKNLTYRKLNNGDLKQFFFLTFLKLKCQVYERGNYSHVKFIILENKMRISNFQITDFPVQKMKSFLLKKTTFL